MKKGQRIRVLKTGELGTVADRELIRRGGRVSQYVQVRLDSRPTEDRWYKAEELGDTRQKCRVTFDDGRQRLFLDVDYDYERENIHLAITGEPENFATHDSSNLNFHLCAKLLKALGCKAKDLHPAEP